MKNWKKRDLIKTQLAAALADEELVASASRDMDLVQYLIEILDSFGYERCSECLEWHETLHEAYSYGRLCTRCYHEDVVVGDQEVKRNLPNIDGGY